MTAEMDRRQFLERLALSTAALMGGSLTLHASSASAKAGGTLRIGVPENFSSLDPYKKIGRLDYNAVINIFDTLVTYGPDFVPAPALAESWEQIDDKTWRFRLRRGVVFSDGTAFDAEAAKYAIEKMKSSNFGSQFEPISSVVVVDPDTVEVRCSTAFPTILVQFTQQYASVVSPKAYAASADAFGRMPVGSGPFKVESFDPGRELVLAKNPDYWRKDEAGVLLPYLDKVVWSVLPDNETASLALQNGEIDFLYEAPIALATALAKTAGLSVVETPTLGWNYIMFQCQMKPFDNPHLRRAVQLGIDRQTIIDTVTFGHGAAALGPIAPGSWAYDASIGTSGFAGSAARIDAAKKELADGGMADGFEFSLTYPAESPFDGMAQAIQAQLGAIGIRVNLDGKDIGAVLDQLFAGKFTALLIDWSGRIDEALAMPSFFTSSGGNNFGKYANPQVDDLLAKAGTAQGIDGRKALYAEAQKLIVADSPHVWISVPTEIRAMRDTVKGFVNYGDVRLRAATVSVE